MIINLTGAHGVGKTTVARRISSLFPEIHLVEEFAYKDTGFDTSQKEGFLRNEEIYFTEKKEKYSEAIRFEGITLFVRGMEDLLYYISAFPGDNGYSWKIDGDFEYLTNEISGYKSDLIIFLDADRTTIENRCMNDIVKKRELVEGWYEKKYKPFRDYILRHNYAMCIDTTSKSIEDVVQNITALLKQ